MFNSNHKSNYTYINIRENNLIHNTSLASYNYTTPYSVIGGHNKGASSKLHKYYTKDIAINATRYLKSDLKLFHYPSWDGLDAEKYLDSLKYQQSSSLSSTP